MAQSSIEYDELAGVYRTYHDFGGDVTLSETVAAAVAALEPDLSVAQPLADCVSLDALDALFVPNDGTPRAGACVTFHLAGYQVTAACDGEVVVYPPTDGIYRHDRV
ncbi:MAG: HalOD1 output domain-containing protein [Halobacteriales archaeon]|nr:HalOD1 output domain-containing protein [Halobacteriales archaeon]